MNATMTIEAADLSFTALERAVLRDIAAREPEIGAALQAQFDAATVTGRQNTRAGFYTDFLVARTVASISTRKRMIGEVWAEIAGFADPMTFLVFIEDGYANCLEGAAVGDSTVDLDLDTVEFRILPI